MTRQTKTIEINKSIDVLATIPQYHRGWWEYEMWCRIHNEWNDNAKPKKFNPLGKAEIEQINAVVTENNKLDEFCDYVSELENQGHDHDTAINIAYNRCY